MTVPVLAQPATAAVTPACAIEPPVTQSDAVATVVVVDGGEQVLDLLESVLGAGFFDIVVVESSQRAYSQIRRAQPALVIISVAFDEPSGFQVLSMLAADETTKHIPVLIHAANDLASAPATSASEEAAML